MHIRRYLPFLFACAMILAAASVAGCTSSPDRSRADGNPAARGTTVAGDLPHASPNLPAERPSPARPSVTVTVNPENTLVEDLAALKETLSAVSAAWDPTGLTCAARSCTAGFADASGNTMAVTATLYDSAEQAAAAYGAAKSAAGRTVDITAGDSGYAWQRLSMAGGGVLEKNAVFLLEYTSSSGPADISAVTSFAQELAGAFSP